MGKMNYNQHKPEREKRCYKISHPTHEWKAPVWGKRQKLFRISSSSICANFESHLPPRPSAEVPSDPTRFFLGHFSHQPPIPEKFRHSGKKVNQQKLKTHSPHASVDIAIARAIISNPASILRTFLTFTTAMSRFDKLSATSAVFPSSIVDDV